MRITAPRTTPITIYFVIDFFLQVFSLDITTESRVAVLVGVAESLLHFEFEDGERTWMEENSPSMHPASTIVIVVPPPPPPPPPPPERAVEVTFRVSVPESTAQPLTFSN